MAPFEIYLPSSVIPLPRMAEKAGPENPIPLASGFARIIKLSVLPKSTSESVAKKVVIAQKKANVEIKKIKKDAEAKIKELKKQSIVKKKK